MNIPLVDLKAQYLTIKEEIGAVIQDVLDNTAFILGENVENFEKAFAQYYGVAHGVGVSSGTSAIQLALEACGLEKGSEVITVPNTFIATTEAITSARLKPRFVGIDEETYTLDPEKLEAAITKKTSAILPVHLYGQPCDIDPIKEIAEKHSLKVVADCAQCHGAEYKGSKKATLCDVGCFSFYPGKNLGAYGDGGMVLTDDEEIAEKVRLLRNHGRQKKYEHRIEGYNHRLDALQAAILNVKLRHLDEWTYKRRGNAKKYNELIESVETPVERDYAKHVYHLYVVRAKNRDELKEKLKEQGISAGVHYPLPLHMQPACNHYGYGKGDFPITERCAEEILSLPMYPELTDEQIRFIADTLNK